MMTKGGPVGPAMIRFAAQWGHRDQTTPCVLRGGVRSPGSSRLLPAVPARRETRREGMADRARPRKARARFGASRTLEHRDRGSELAGIDTLRVPEARGRHLS